MFRYSLLTIEPYAVATTAIADVASMVFESLMIDDGREDDDDDFGFAPRIISDFLVRLALVV